MSEENVAVLRKGYAAVNRGDIDGFLADVHPDVEFTSLIAEAEGETFRGHDGGPAVVDGGCAPAGRPARGA
jgi:ketosteroid isomerase-like protein